MTAGRASGELLDLGVGFVFNAASVNSQSSDVDGFSVEAHVKLRGCREREHLVRQILKCRCFHPPGEEASLLCVPQTHSPGHAGCTRVPAASSPRLLSVALSGVPGGKTI